MDSEVQQSLEDTDRCSFCGHPLHPGVVCPAHVSDPTYEDGWRHCGCTSGVEVCVCGHRQSAHEASAHKANIGRCRHCADCPEFRRASPVRQEDPTPAPDPEPAPPPATTLLLDVTGGVRLRIEQRPGHPHPGVGDEYHVRLYELRHDEFGTAFWQRTNLNVVTERNAALYHFFRRLFSTGVCPNSLPPFVRLDLPLHQSVDKDEEGSTS